MTGAASRSRLSSWRALTTGLAVALGFAAPVQAQSLTPEVAPAAWVAYAETATRIVTTWLEKDGEAASSLRRHLHQMRPADDQPAPPLVIKLWIDPQGVISRIDFAPFTLDEVDAVLRSTIDGRQLGRPPLDMLQPLRISVELEAAVPETDRLSSDR